MKTFILFAATLNVLPFSVIALPRPETTIIILNDTPSYPRNDHADAPFSDMISPNSAQEALNELNDSTQRK